eukprot:g33620.t1
MYETLTPRENLWFASAFILPKLSKDTRNSVIEGVIEKLNLKKCADTVVGSPGLVRGISGGERKRTNVALSLLGNPSLLLLDEPTSGLDSKMSDSLMRDVKQIGQQGCTVVATIHQPSEAVFTRFDKVLLLETGKIAYYGPVASLRSSLSSLGFACPTGTPLPELLLDVLEVPKEEEEISSYRNKLEKLKQMSDTAKGDHGSPTKSEAPVKRAGPCGQLVTLFKRELVNVKRNKALTVVRAVQSVASSVLIGLIFLQLERNMSSLQPRLFSSFLLVFAQFLFAMLGVVNAFPAERAVFLRETQDKLYHPAMFYFAKVSIDTIMQCLFPILVVAISYPLIGLNGESADRILWFYTIMAVVSNCGAAVGFAVSAAVPSVNLALSIAPGLVMPQLLLAGIFIKVEDLPQPFNAISYLMVARYAVQATVVNEFSCTTKDACSPLVWRNASADLCWMQLFFSSTSCACYACVLLVPPGPRARWSEGRTRHRPSAQDTIFYNFIALLCLMVFFRLQGLNVLLMSFRKATTGSCTPSAMSKVCRKRPTPRTCSKACDSFDKTWAGSPGIPPQEPPPGRGAVDRPRAVDIGGARRVARRLLGTGGPGARNAAWRGMSNAARGLATDRGNLTEAMYNWRVAAVENALKRMGKETGPLNVSDLTALGHLDQYHYGGIEANDHVIELLGIDETVHCLDVGSGIGGPSRYIASKTGCRITGIELQADICTAGEKLTERVPELVGKVKFKIGDIIELSKKKEIPAESFDHFLSLLVFLHISDRAALLKACFEATKPGGTFLIEDFAAKPGRSFSEHERDGLLNVVFAPTVTTPEEYVLALQQAGFVDIQVVDLSEQWQKWTKARHDLYAESKEETVRTHGEEIFNSRLKFYKVVMELFEGNLGGVRITGRKPGTLEARLAAGRQKDLQLRLGGWFISYENGKAAVSVTHAKKCLSVCMWQVEPQLAPGKSRQPDGSTCGLTSLMFLPPWRSIFRMALRCWAIAGLVSFTESCTNLIVSPGASADGSTLFSYTADSGSVYGTLGHYPAGQHSAGAKRPVWDWDSGKYLGEIDEAPYTYNVIGNLNEHGLAIGETTFGGNETLSGGEGVMDYGSLIWVTLQRCKTAREAILMFDQLVKEYGYVSEGESFTIADAKEVWVLEMIGKGKFEKGAVWVAVRIPDGHVSGHANQARIQRFPLHDAENCVHCSMQFWAPTTCGKPHAQPDWVGDYGNHLLSHDSIFFHRRYVLGQNVSAAARMPLSIPVKSKISNVELMSHMRNHYEGTALDSRLDVGAGSSGSPFRVRPLVWKQGNASYVHERMVGTPQAGWNFVAQLRGWLPGPMAGLLWFGVDDASFSVHAPFHGGTTRVPQGYADGFGDALHYSRSAFWAFNTVANFIYPRWFLADAVMHRARMSEQTFVAEELLAKALYKKDPAKAIELLTARDVARAERVVEEEFALFGDLMAHLAEIIGAGGRAAERGSCE